jgi:hypothetical protein
VSGQTEVARWSAYLAAGEKDKARDALIGAGISLIGGLALKRYVGSFKELVSNPASPIHKVLLAALGPTVLQDAWLALRGI